MKLKQRLEKLEQAQPTDQAIPIITLAPGEKIPAGMTPIIYVRPEYWAML